MDYELRRRFRGCTTRPAPSPRKRLGSRSLMGNRSRYGRKGGSAADAMSPRTFVSDSSQIKVRRKEISSLCEVAHTSFRSVRVIHRCGRGKLMLRSTPRIEVSQRSREARLRLERLETLIVVAITRWSLLVPRTGGLAAKLLRNAKPIGSRP